MILIRLGLTLRCAAEPRHIWVVLSDPNQTRGDILLVNFTTLRENTFDTSCILGPADYSELAHESVIAFSGSYIGSATKLEKAIQKRYFSIMDPQIPEAALEKIIAAARSSTSLPRAKKDLLPTNPPNRGEIHEIINYDE